MITVMQNLPENIIGFKYESQITAEDYESVLFPLFEAASKKYKELNVLCQLSESFKGFKLGALKDDFQIGVKYFSRWNKIAFVSDKEGMNHLVKVFGFLIPAKVETFSSQQVDEALRWLSE